MAVSQEKLKAATTEELPSQLDFLESISRIADLLDRGKGNQREHLEELDSLLSLVPAIYGTESEEAISALHASTAILRIAAGREFVSRGNSTFLRWSYTLIGDAKALLLESEKLKLRERCWMIFDSYENALAQK